MTARVRALIAMVKDDWGRHGVGAPSGVTDVELEAFERKHGIRFPEDVADYFKAVNGMGNDECDQFGIRFWSLDELHPVVEELSSAEADAFKDYFVFADYSIWTHGYAVRLSQPGGSVVIVGGEKPVAVAPTFCDFLQLYVIQPDRLFPGKARKA